MLNLDMTLGEFLLEIKETNSKLTKIILQEENGDSRYAIFVTMGKKATDEVIELLKPFDE